MEFEARYDQQCTTHAIALFERNAIFRSRNRFNCSTFIQLTKLWNIHQPVYFCFPPPQFFIMLPFRCHEQWK